MRIPALLLFLVILSPALAFGEKQWPGVEFTEVKGYIYSVNPLTGTDIVSDGKLNPSVEKVVRLSPKQVPRIALAIHEQEKGGVVALCYEPHHAFVYFDKLGRPVAWMELCYKCNQWSSFPALPENKIVKLPALTPLCRELGLPLPGDKLFTEHLKREAKLAEAINEDTPTVRALFGAVPESIDPNDPVPPLHEWPFRSVEQVKLMDFNREEVQNSVFQGGKINSTVSTSVTLTKEQRRKAWECMQAPTLAQLDEKHVFLQRQGGELVVENTETGVSETRTRIPKHPRYALVCFDEKDTPVAWVEISFASGTYSATPSEGATKPDRRIWQLRPLKRFFNDMGIKIP